MKKRSFLDLMRTRPRTGWEYFLLLTAGALTLFYATRLYSVIAGWHYLLDVYPPALVVYLGVSGLVFGLCFPPLIVGIWRRAPWRQRNGFLLFTCWFLSAAAELAYAWLLGWRAGWMMNSLLLLVLVGLIFRAMLNEKSRRRHLPQKEDS